MVLDVGDDVDDTPVLSVGQSMLCQLHLGTSTIKSKAATSQNLYLNSIFFFFVYWSESPLIGN